VEEVRPNTEDGIPRKGPAVYLSRKTCLLATKRKPEIPFEKNQKNRKREFELKTSLGGGENGKT